MTEQEKGVRKTFGVDCSLYLVQSYLSLYNMELSRSYSSAEHSDHYFSPFPHSFALLCPVFVLPPEGILVELICVSANNLVKARKRLLIMLFQKHKERRIVMCVNRNFLLDFLLAK